MEDLAEFVGWLRIHMKVQSNVHIPVKQRKQKGQWTL